MAQLRDPRPSEELRWFPTPKWIRARRNGETIVDSRGALIVWLPGRIVPVFAFPPEDVQAAARPVEGLDGHVLVDWDAADEWLEEDEPLLAHARDPFARIDVRASSRHVVVRHEGELLAESRRPVLLFETGLPTRCYLPREDVRLDLLEPSATRTACAYKGFADHFAHRGRDVAWTYRDPLPDMPLIRDLIAFYDERVDLEVDGERQQRPVTKWS